VWGETQLAKLCESTRQRKVAPASLELNVNVGVASIVRPGGPVVIVVSGGAASRVETLLTS
jgi:hypothetical protein